MLQNENFSYFVGKSASLRTSFSFRHSVESGFKNLDNARAYAALVRDGLNWVNIYDVTGKVVEFSK